MAIENAELVHKCCALVHICTETAKMKSDHETEAGKKIEWKEQRSKMVMK